MKRLLLVVLIVCVLLFSGCSSFRIDNSSVSLNNSNFEITFIDVGQADSALVACDNHYMLIDGGNVADSSLIVSFLSSKGISALDYIVNSHPDEDHVGGLAGALAKFTAKNVMSSVNSYSTNAFKNFEKYTVMQNLTIKLPKYREQFNVGNSNIQILSSQKDYDDVNDNSVVMKITYGDNSFMFTGDISDNVEKDIIKSEKNLNSTVLKVAHHGSKTSTCQEWIDAVKPKYAVISVGKDNQYGHPSLKTIERLQQSNVTIYRTDLNGNIVLTSDGTNISFKTEKNSNNNLGFESSNSNCNYIGNKVSKVFHVDTCHGLPQHQNRVYFKNKEEAIKEDYRPCGNCNP